MARLRHQRLFVFLLIFSALLALAFVSSLTEAISQLPKLEPVPVELRFAASDKKTCSLLLVFSSGDELASSVIEVGVINTLYIYSNSFSSIDLDTIKKYGSVSATGYTSFTSALVKLCKATAIEARYACGPHVVSVGDANNKTAQENADVLRTLSRKPVNTTVGKVKVSRIWGSLAKKTQRITTLIHPKIWWRGVVQTSRCPTGGYGHQYESAAKTLSKKDDQGKLIRRMAEEFSYHVKDHAGDRGFVLNAETHGGCFAVNKAYLSLAFEELKPTFQVRVRPIPKDPSELSEFKASLALDRKAGISQNTIEIIRDNRVGHSLDRGDYSLLVRPMLSMLLQYGSTDFVNILKQFRREGPFVIFDCKVVQVPLRATKRVTKISILGIPIKRAERHESRKEDKKIVNFTVDKLNTKAMAGSSRAYNPLFLYGPLEKELFEDIADRAEIQGNSRRTFYFVPCGTQMVEKAAQRWMQIYIIKPILGVDAINILREIFGLNPLEAFRGIKDALPEETMNTAIKECPDMEKSVGIGSKAIDVDKTRFLLEVNNR